MKLTEKQIARLSRLARSPEYHISGKPEVRSLERNGLVETNEFHCTFITPAGHAALEKETRE